MPAELPPRPVLSPSEHRYLWLLSQGHTTRQTQEIMGINRTPTLGMRVRQKLESVTTTQAMHRATLLDMLGPYLECGSMRGYRAHHGRREDPCRACRRYFADYCERTGFTQSRRPELDEAESRLLRALDAGRSVKTIARNWGCSTRTLDKLRSALYLKLDVAHLPWKARRPAALEEGRRLGYLRPDGVQMPGEAPRRRGPLRLTEMEIRTLSAVADGTSLSQAGRILGGIPGSSVSSRLARIYFKLDVLHHGHGERREAAVKEARNRGYAL